MAFLRLRWTQRQIILFLAVMTGALLLGSVAMAQITEKYFRDMQIGFNWTDSLPGLFYVVRFDESPSERGELVAFRPPHNRFYRDDSEFVKIIGGVPGDVVTEKDGRFYVNGEDLGVVAKPFTAKGEPLEKGPTGVIPPGHYFVYTTHEHGFDSRYKDIGWISEDQILGGAHFTDWY